MDTLRMFGAGARTLAFTLAAWLAGVCASPALAATILLDAGDLSLMEQTAQEALEKNQTGQTSTWENPATDRLGTVTPLRTYPSGARPCREYQMTLTFGGGTEAVHDSACRLPDGKWQSNSHAGLAGSRFEGGTYTYLYREPPRYHYYEYRDPFWYRGPYWRNRYFFHFRYDHYDHYDRHRHFRRRHFGPRGRFDGPDGRSTERAQAFEGGKGPSGVRGPSPDPPRAAQPRPGRNVPPGWHLRPEQATGGQALPRASAEKPREKKLTTQRPPKGSSASSVRPAPVPPRPRAATHRTPRPPAHGQPRNQGGGDRRPAKGARRQPAAPVRTGAPQ